MPRYKKGTMVRMIDPFAHKTDDRREEASDMIASCGWLYVVERFLPAAHLSNEHGYDAYECKSLQTGSLEQLFPYEITTKKESKRD